MSPEAVNDHEQKLRELLANAVQRLDEGGQGGLESFLSEHPNEAAGLRRRLQLLFGAGMLAADGAKRGESDMPERLGEFRLHERLGSGGMGIVYLAEQESLKRQVALKLIRPEHLYFPQARERFQREIDAVAQLQHPGIVRVYSAGEEAGLPYFTMEMVEGVSLDRLLKELSRTPARELGEEQLRQALVALGGDSVVVHGKAGVERTWVEICCEWLRELALALAYAHGAGVLHRDLKPANVMVTWSGRVVLLDFGLASTREGNKITRTGSQLGSLPYMAPEQVRGDRDAIDARTDVYALGVTMYEMLTLHSPFQDAGSSDEDVRRRIVQATPASLRQHNPAVSWDAETVCLCAMAPEPARRYLRARDLAEDLQNVLGLRPLTAQRPSTAARLHRFVRRRPAVSVALAMGFLLVVVAPTVVALREYRLRTQITAANEHARVENETREETLRFLNDDLLAAVRPDQVGRDASMRAVLDNASRRIDGRFPDRPEVEAAIRTTLGYTYRLLGELDVAEQHLLRAVDLSRRHLGEHDRKRIETERRLASVYQAQGRVREAEQLERAAFDTLRVAFGMADPATLASATNLGQQLTELGRHEQAATLLEQVVDIRLRMLGEEHKHTQTAMAGLGLAFFNQGRLDEAEPWLRRALAVSRRTKGDEHPDTLVSMNNWANLLSTTGHLEESLAVHEQSVALNRRVNGEWHFHTVTSMVATARTLSMLGRFDEAEARAREAIEAAADLPPDHPARVNARLFGIGELCRKKAHDEALRAADQLLHDLQAGSKGSGPLRLHARITRAKVCEAMGRRDEAVAELGTVLSELAGKEDAIAAGARTIRGRCLRAMGDFAAAEAELLAAEAFFRVHASQDRRLSQTLEEIVQLNVDWRRPAEAATWRQRLAEWQETKGRAGR